jgi:hypothetical protein
VPDSNRRLADEDLDTCPWQLRIEPGDASLRFGLAEAYFHKAKEARDPADPCHHVFALLSTVTGLSIDSDEGEGPFAPQTMLDEVAPDDLRLLASRAADVEHPELRARIRDLSWVVNRDHQAGREAVADYLAAAEGFAEAGVGFLYLSRLRRALGLAKSLNHDESVGAVVGRIEAFLDAYDVSHKPRFLARELLEALLEARAGDPERQSANAERIAKASDAAREWDRALAHWQVKAKFDERLGRAEDARQARALAAASLASQAREEAAKGAPWTGGAATHLLEAMKMYREAGEPAQADALHAEALALQRVARGEAQPFSIEVDLTEHVDQARAAVRGKELFPALAALAAVTGPTDVAWLRELTEEEIRAFPFQHWIQSTLGDDRGRTVARRAARGDGDEADDERALRADMLKNADWVRGAKTASFIEPARHQIMLEHRPRLHHLMDLVAASPFVPQDREPIFARGLLAGLRGDFLVATHLLVPQLENSIRVVFEQHGVVTSTLVGDDVQEDRTLGALLQGQRYRALADAIFGEALAFDLRGVLVERWGANLRNRVAHGLMSTADFTNVQCCYAWWLTLRLVMWPHLLAMTEVPGDDTGPEAGTVAEAQDGGSPV